MTRRRKVYFALCIDHYGAREYKQLRRAIRAQFPVRSWELIEPAQEDWDNARWLAAWEQLRGELAALVLWPRPAPTRSYQADHQGTVGRGCWQEVTDLQARAVPVFLLSLMADGAGRFYELGRIKELPEAERNNRYYAKVTRGAQITPADALNMSREKSEAK